MPYLSKTELVRIEKVHVDGISARAVTQIFVSRGLRFSEATLRKYVQLGLLPTSRRVGLSGHRRGSSGLYPPYVVRLVDAIKSALSAGHSLDQIRASGSTLTAEIYGLHHQTQQLLARFSSTLAAQPAGSSRRRMQRDLLQYRRALEANIQGLGLLSTTLSSPPVDA